MAVATREAAKADGPCYCGAPSLARRPGAGQQRTCLLLWFLFFPFFSLGELRYVSGRGLLWLLGKGPFSRKCVTSPGCAGALRVVWPPAGLAGVLVGEGEGLARSGWVALGG